MAHGDVEHLAADTLIRLTYVSTRAAYLSDEEVVQLALDSNHNNRARDVTGCLWFGETRFFQVLEGRRETVDALYEKIVADRRHHHVRALSYAKTDARVFGRWGLAQLKSEQDNTLVDLITQYAGVSWESPKTTETSLLSSIMDRLAAVLRQGIQI